MQVDSAAVSTNKWHYSLMCFLLLIFKIFVKSMMQDIQYSSVLD